MSATLHVSAIGLVHMNTEPLITAVADNALTTDEAINNILRGTLVDLARSFIVRHQPIMVLHNPQSGQTVTFAIRRELFAHSLLVNRDGQEHVLLRKRKVTILLKRMLGETEKLLRTGFAEI